MRKIIKFLIISLFLTHTPLQAREVKVGQRGDFSNYEEAWKHFDKKLIEGGGGLRFEVETTQLGFLTSKVSGFATEYEAQALFDDQSLKVSQMKVMVKSDGMDTRNRMRDKKLHGLCLSSNDYPEMIFTIDSPIAIADDDKSGFKEVKGKALIRSKTFPIVIKLKASKANRNGESLVLVEGMAYLSLKSLEIPDPSISVAKLSDTIKVEFKIAAAFEKK